MAGTLLYSEAYEIQEKGRKIGREEGREEGREKGLEEGRARGWLEGQLKMLKQLVKEGVLSEDDALRREEAIRSEALALAEDHVKYDKQ